MSFRKGFFNSLLVSGGYNYANQVIVFLSSVITSRLLEPSTFGFVGLITVFTGFISIFSDSGISLAIVRSDYLRTYHKSVDNLAFFVGVILCLLTCLLAYPIAFFYQNNDLVYPIMVMSSLFVFRSMALVRGALLSKNLQFGVIGRITLLSSAVQIGLNIIMAFLGLGYWSLIIPQIVSAIVIIIFYERVTQLGFKFYPTSYLRVAYKLTKRIIGNLMGFNVINYWARNLDNLLVGKLFGINDLGIYNRGYNLLTMPLGLVTGIIGNVLFPSLKKLKNEGGDIFKEYFFILKVITFITYPISFLLIIFPENLVVFLWGREWIGVSDLLPYFGLLIFSQSLLSTTGNILVLLGKEHVMRISGWISATATISGIIYGSFSSIQSIAQFYSLSFILFVLPFNMFYLFIKTLNFDKKIMLRFWLPIIIASLCIWTSCYFKYQNLKVTSVISLLLIVVFQNFVELRFLSTKIFNKLGLAVPRVIQ